MAPPRRAGYACTMRYVVKDKETGQFLGASGEWTRYLSEAQRFPNGLSLNLHLEALDQGDPAKIEVLQLPIG